MLRSLLALSIMAMGCRRAGPPAPDAAAAANAYVDSRQCKGCHAGIFQTFESHGMARSFGNAASAAAGLPSGRLTHRPSARRYEVDGLVQRRVELDSQGREHHRFELAATHYIGSGNHARTFLHQSSNGEFTELPLSWYTAEKRWELSPGFDRPQPRDFTRRVDERCLFCHTGFAPGAGAALPSGIDCQRCHGPGEAHVKRRGPIVNPAKLAAERQLDICMQCHLETTSSELPPLIVRFERTLLSFRPGEPLTDYAVHFDRRSDADRFEIAGQAYRLRQSACFLKSGGRLTCTTCHGAHSPRPPNASTAAAACRNCHARAATDGHGNADCASCHMPARKTDDAVHVSMTDHFIRRRPAVTERPGGGGSADPIPYFPESLTARDREIYTGAALILGGADRARGIALLERHRGPGLPARALGVLGEGYIAEGKPERAGQVFTAMPPSPTRHYNLAQALDRQGRVAEARRLLEEAASRDTLTAEAECALGNLLAKTGQHAEAVAHYRRALAARPLYPEALAAMAVPLAALGQVREATNSARQAVSLDPNDTRARYNLGKLLQNAGDEPGALHEFRQALLLNPRLADAHVALGQVLGDGGRVAEAVAHFRAALGIDPAHAEARRMLAIAGFER